MAYDPEQIYELLKFVYTDPRFPGPYTTAYTSGGDQENPTYYGGVERGWDIPFKEGSGHFEIGGDIIIGIPAANLSWIPGTGQAYFGEISVYDNDNGTLLTQWTSSSSATALPSTWDLKNAPLFGTTNNVTMSQVGSFSAFSGSCTITIPASELENTENVRVVVKGYSDYNNTDIKWTSYMNVVNVDGVPFDLAGYTASKPRICENIVNRKQWVDTGAKRPTDVLITANTTVYFKAIKIKDENGNTIVDWNVSQPVPNDWCVTGTSVTNLGTYLRPNNYLVLTNGHTNTGGTSNAGTIRIPAEKFQGKKSITVEVTARGGQLALCNKYRPIALSNSDQVYTKTIQFPPAEDYDTYRPNHEGYTALIVSVYDESGKEGRLPWANWPMDRACKFTTKADVIKYIKDNIQFVKLLTDGVRVGDGENIGTVFRCDGTYNKFFFLGKGQARKKDSGVLAAIGTGDPLWPDFMCEQLPFHYMFEQFSPTYGTDEADIEDFYTEMMDGKLYDIYHDCPSVIQNEHQFSMSGKDGTTAYAFTGMNFFIPDYRLKYFTLDPGHFEQQWDYMTDGRDMNPYIIGDANAPTKIAGNQADHIGVNFARYNPAHAPKVGIYKITLDATVAPVADYDSVSNPNYEVTLNWVSSLDQMSGSHYPQHYNIYQIVVDADGTERRVKVAEVDHDDENDFNHYNIYSIIVDENGNETRGEKIGQGNVTTDDPTVLTLPTKYLQGDYSQTFTFIVEGWPVNSDRRPSFFAWSNPDQVIIPGRSQFLSLHLDHYESDFIINGASDLAYMKNYRNSLITKPITGEHNYYRNFVSVNSEDVMHGLTIDKINQGMHTFDMLRSTLIPKEEGELKIAQIVFDHPVATNAKEVGYTITYVDNTQFLLANKFIRDSLKIPATGTVRIKGNGDLVIQPSGYNVNFYSINVTRGNQTWSWTYTQTTGLNAQTKLPTGWYLTPGSMWVQDHANDPYYLEGGGYIAIPNVINGSEEVTVTIKASGDLSTHSNILVDDRIWNIANGDAVEHTWTIPASSSQTPTLNYYEKITSVDQITSGSKYLIVCEGKSRAFNGELDWSGLDSQSNSADVTISGDHKITTLEGDRYYFTINKTGNNYNIRSQTGYNICSYRGYDDVIYANSNANTITFDNNGNVIIRDSYYTSARLQYNEKSSGSNNYYYFKYFTSNKTPIQLYKYVETSAPDPDYGLLRIGALHFVDQFKAPTDKDKHPYRYGYQLKEVKSGGGYGKASSMVEVPVQHTNSKVNGYFTLDSIDNDIYIKADTNLMTAEVVTELSNTNSMVFFNTIQARRKQNPVVFGQYATILQQQTDFTYKEMKNPSSRFGKIYDPGIHQYFDSVKLTGKYAVDTCKRVYIPSVMTRGIDRRYFTDDTLHNTYGAPIYRTGVGKVELETATAVLMQSNYGGVEWQDEEKTTCNLFCLDDIKAIGYLPSNSVSNVDYEPYMFRLYVKSENGKLRPYTQGEHNEAVAATIDPNDTTQTHGPLCVWSGYVKSIPDQAGVSDYGEMYGKQLLDGASNNADERNEKDYKYIYEKKKVNRTQGASWDKDKYNAFFGAVKDIVYLKDADGNIVTNNNKPVMKEQIDPKDLTIYVRFYYIGKGLADGHTPRIAHSNVPEASAPAGAPRRDGEAPGNGYPGPAGYPADSPGVPPGIMTAVNELMYQGEIVKTTYYNLQGMESSKPFDGLNIVVNRYSDGTTQALKVLY